MKIVFILVIIAASCLHAVAQTQDLNVDFMTRGYFYAGSAIRDRSALGGFGPSDNFPRALLSGQFANFARFGEVSLVVLTDEPTTFNGKYSGLRVLLINSTNSVQTFSASDSRLYIVQEAIDRDKQWKPVEYLPSSWCGNSYHNVFLGPYEYWQFSAARYNGRFKTKLRFVLTEKSSDNTISIYSNEFDGSVNPNQFKIQQGHTPAGLMDPYNN